MKDLRSLCTAVVVVSLALLIGATQVSAQSFASAERRSIAVGHYARARALLVEALAEFERGRHVAQPDVLVDAERWRTSVISRAEELNRLLDPQPRVTRSGAQYKASKALIRRDREKLSNGPRDANNYGEAQQSTELNRTADTEPTPTRARVAERRSRAMMSAPLSVPAVEHTETAAPVAKETAAAAPAMPAPEASATAEEPDEVSKAIEAAIQARLEKLRSESTDEVAVSNE